MDKPKFDQSTFMGRLLSMYEVIDPRNLLISEAQLQKSKDLIAAYKKGGRPAGVTDEDLWEARTNIEVNIHPVTGETLFLPGRMSAFVPTNVPLCAFMLMASTPQMQALGQFMNQSYNCVNNYVNRSGATVNWGDLLSSYGIAVTSAVSIALGAGALVKAVPALSAAGPFVPYMAVASAGSCNVAFTRKDEWQNGVPICDASGKNLGVSVKAGETAVLQTVLTRSCFLPIAPLVLPVLGMKVLSPILFCQPVAAAAELVLVTVCISSFLPVALAILPTTMELDVKSLEPQFQNLTDDKGQPITKVFANKGL